MSRARLQPIAHLAAAAALTATSLAVASADQSAAPQVGLADDIAITGLCRGTATYSALLQDKGDTVDIRVVLRGAGRSKSWTLHEEERVRSADGTTVTADSFRPLRANRRGVIDVTGGAYEGTVHRYEFRFVRSDNKDVCSFAIRA